jgi:bacteriorhodopsin
MKKLKLFALTAVALMGASGVANAEMIPLETSDFVGISFWVISMAMLAATAFFFLEVGSVATGWRTSIIVAGLVTGIAFIHYMYMREVWINTGASPTVFRYIDWLITVPLQMIEFYLILAAVGKANSGIFWRLLLGTVVMLVGGYLGEAGYLGEGSGKMLGFIIGMAGWFYILYEVFSGEAGKAAAKSGNKALVTAFGAMRMIVTVGWAIYPLGYIFGYLTGGVDAESLNVIYNAADFLNKIAFGLIIWAAAMSQPGRAR